jgi:hypothetical protein
MEVYEFQPFSEGALVDTGYISLVALNDPEFVCNFTENNNCVILYSFSGLNNYTVAKLQLGVLDGMETLWPKLNRPTINEK